MLNNVIKCIGKRLMLMLYGLMRMAPLDSRTVFFESNLGRNCAGNVREIYRMLISTADAGLRPYTCVWSFETYARGAGSSDIEKLYDMPEIPEGGSIRLITVKRKSPRYFYFLARAKLWISNCRMPNYLKKRKGQVYIQTWHGTPLKKLALDMTRVDMAGEENIDKYHRNFRSNSNMWDYLLSQSPFASAVFRRCFDFRGTLLEIGYPRNDRLLSADVEVRGRELRDRLELPHDKKLVLYAPTWRDDEANGKDTYSFSTALDFGSLLKRLGSGYVVLIKSHYLVKDSLDLFKYRGAVRSYGEKYDIADLYVVSDMLVTDYSSVMFDYSLLGRPMVFYCYDLEKYRENLRGFYFNLEETAPGPIVRTTEELADAILHYDAAEWRERYKLFKERFNTFDDGRAAAKTGALIHEIIMGRQRKKL